MIIPLTSSLLLIVAIVIFLDLTPERVTDDLLKIISPKQTLRNKVKIAQGKKKSRRISVELAHIKDAMVATGKANQFATVCSLSLVLMFLGGIFAILINNPFLIPIFALAFCLIPFVYAKGRFLIMINILSRKWKQHSQLLQHPISVVTILF